MATDRKHTTCWAFSHLACVTSSPHIDGLVQERRNSIANTLELCLSCNNPSTCHYILRRLFSLFGQTVRLSLTFIASLKASPLVPHICVSELGQHFDSDNGLSPIRHHAIIWTSAGNLLIETLGTIFSEIVIEINTFSFKKMHLKMSFVKWRPYCPGEMN